MSDENQSRGSKAGAIHSHKGINGQDNRRLLFFKKNKEMKLNTL
jgi:hypothetical protein